MQGASVAVWIVLCLLAGALLRPPTADPRLGDVPEAEEGERGGNREASDLAVERKAAVARARPRGATEQHAPVPQGHPEGGGRARGSGQGGQPASQHGGDGQRGDRDRAAGAPRQGRTAAQGREADAPAQELSVASRRVAAGGVRECSRSGEPRQPPGFAVLRQRGHGGLDVGRAVGVGGGRRRRWQGKAGCLLLHSSLPHPDRPWRRARHLRGDHQGQSRAADAPGVEGAQGLDVAAAAAPLHRPLSPPRLAHHRPS
mmetsp:Transcript_50039/g.117855  ORF Transcript_50039/g.117855 Transcript_50039/m.117855 type:complete len:258 (-) Transcript_50039:760-1533(-)